jgi:hypothetical protein
MRALQEEVPARGENQPLHNNGCINSHNALQTLSHFLKTWAQFFIQQVCGWNVSIQIKMEETHLKTEDPYVQWNDPPGNKMITCLQRVRFSFRKGPPLTLKNFHFEFTKYVWQTITLTSPLFVWVSFNIFCEKEKYCQISFDFWSFFWQTNLNLTLASLTKPAFIMWNLCCQDCNTSLKHMVLLHHQSLEPSKTCVLNIFNVLAKLSSQFF